MLKGTFSASLGITPNLSPQSSRVLTENLLNDDNIDIHFSNAALTSYYHAASQAKLYDITKGNLEGTEQYTDRLLKIILTKSDDDILLNTIKGDYFFYSMCSGTSDYHIVSCALNNGLRVIVGGTEINMNSFDYIRNTLIKCGTKEKNLKNLLIIKGNVTPYTNLTKLINQWTDVFIPNENIESIIYAKKDYMRFKEMRQIKKIINISNPSIFKINIWPNSISFIFDNICPWNKCRFCTYCRINETNYIENLSANQVIDTILEVCNDHQINSITISDDYVSFKGKKGEVIKGLKQNGIEISAQTGIHLLKNEKYAQDLLNNVDVFTIGLEWTTDFGLNQLNKGITWDDAKKAFKNIKKYYNKNKIAPNIMLDVPVRDKADAILNYDRLLRTKQEMESYNIRWGYIINMLNLYYPENFNAFESMGHIRTPKENTPSGKSAVLQELEKMIKIPTFVNLDSIPYERIDKNGKLIESDISIIPKNILKEIVSHDKFWEIDNKDI